MALDTHFLARGLITQAQLDAAVAEQAATGERLDRALVRLGMLSRSEALAALAEEFQLPVIDPASLAVEPDVLAALPPKIVFRHRCVPIARAGRTLTVAVADPFDQAVSDELRLIAGGPVDLVLADEDELAKFIRAHYGVGGDTLDAMAAGLPGQVEVKASDDAEQAQEASVIKLVNDLLVEAIAERATDVHVEPYEHELIVRYRIDGVLQKANVPAAINRFGPAIISRLKIMASLNIAEKRRPQDGRISFKARIPNAAPQEFDLRVSIIPMLFGEGVVLRVLSKTAVLMSLNDLGMPDGILASWDTLIARPHGILLVTGPTGSGKSTTLYASLNRIVSDAIKIITVEDPVEYHVAGVNQIQVNHKVGLDFASGLRSILRHDPDVVLIGEIRDKETAETAIQASLTGHLVFSTLHTNDAPGAATRLLDMGVEPFLIASSVEGILAQRLVRRICKECAQIITPDPADLPKDFVLPATGRLRRGAGCRACRNTGYRGRLGVYELLRVSEALRHLIAEREPGPVLASKAKAEGNLATLLDDGYEKVRAGSTTLEEVLSAVSA
ncbi:MAG: general secretion pathway protein GspE [Phycisphaerae bacterium]|nr:MAG: general secretion pathway protein GspE [Phycisphaerae bacterium]